MTVSPAPAGVAGARVVARSRRESCDEGSTRGRVADIQRARIVAAMLDVVAERGGASVTVADVVERAGVSRRTFYELFDDGEDCFLAAFEYALAAASQRVVSAYGEKDGWCERIRAGLTALLGFFEEDPTVARMLVAEAGSGGAGTLARRGEVVAQLTAIVERGREQSRMGVAAPPLVGEGIVGGVLAMVASRLLAGDRGSLVGLVNPLMGMIVLPYLGASAARRELDRPVPSVSRTAQQVGSLSCDPFKAAGMRLTYRTVRVLVAIGDRPGASNRLIADAAEVRDQGQISKLLTRLARAGLVVNAGLGPGLGAPNRWSLTESGRRVVATIKDHSGDRALGGVR